MMYNPRFPHTLRVLRISKNAYGEPVTDENGYPVYATVYLSRVVARNSDGSFKTEIVDVLPFGYRSNGKDTRDTAEVESADYALATPMFLTPLDSSDVIEITDYDRTFKCEVVRKSTSNLGSNIWVNELKG